MIWIGLFGVEVPHRDFQILMMNRGYKESHDMCAAIRNDHFILMKSTDLQNRSDYSIE